MNFIPIIIIFFSLFITVGCLFGITQDIKKVFAANQTGDKFNYPVSLKIKIAGVFLFWLAIYIYVSFGPQNTITNTFSTVAPVMLIATCLTMAVMPAYIKYVGHTK